MAKDIIRYDDDDQFRGKPYTRKEAEQAVSQFNHSAVALRHHLLVLFERKAHTALGFVTFEEFASHRLGVDMNKQRSYELRRWAKAERDTLRMVDEPVDASNAVALLEEIVKQPLARDVALELMKLPPVQRSDAWQEVLSLAAPDHSQLSNTKHIVTRRLNEMREADPQLRRETNSAAKIPAKTPQIDTESAPNAGKVLGGQSAPKTPGNGPGAAPAASWGTEDPWSVIQEVLEHVANGGDWPDWREQAQRALSALEWLRRK